MIMTYEIHKKSCKKAIDYMITLLEKEDENVELIFNLIKKFESKLGEYSNSRDPFMPMFLYGEEMIFLKEHKLQYIFQTEKERKLVNFQIFITILIFIFTGTLIILALQLLFKVYTEISIVLIILVIILFYISKSLKIRR